MTRPDAITSILTTGTNLERAKTHNHRVVLDVVRTRGPLRRADIAQITSLSRQTIQNIIAELQQLGLVTLAETPRASGGGRGHPGVDVRFRAEGGTSLGVHMDQLSMVFVLTDLAGAILWRWRTPVRYPDPPAAAALVQDALARLSAEQPDAAGGLVGIGLAMPGPFNVTGIVGAEITSLPHWTDPGLDRRLSDQLGVPVMVENDAAAAAVGEHLFGHGRQLDSFVYVYVGMGLGAGLHLNGELFRGVTRNAGEIGHMVVVPNGLPCPCGNRGCLERYLSLRAVYDAAGIETPDEASTDAVLDRFRAGDPALVQWLDRGAAALRSAVNILDSVLDTAAIVVGGQLPRPILDVLIGRLDPLLKSAGTGDRAADRVRVGSSYIDATAVGAAALAVRAAISPRIEMLLKEADRGPALRL